MLKKLLFVFIGFACSTLVFAQSNAEKLQKSAERKAAMDNFAGALEDIQKAIGPSSKNSSLYFTRGMIHYMEGNRSLADEDFEKVVSMPAKDADSLRVKALAYNRLRDYKARDEVLQELLGMEPKTAKDFLAHSVAHVIRKSFGEAASMCDAAIEKDPKFVPAYVMRASLNSVQRDGRNYDAAIADYQKAVSLEPDNPELYYLLGRAQLEGGKSEDSVATFSKCLELAPESKRVQRILRKAETGR